MLFGNHKNSSFAREKAARSGDRFRFSSDLVRCDFTPKLEPVLRQKPNDFSRAALQPRKPFAVILLEKGKGFSGRVLPIAD